MEGYGKTLDAAFEDYGGKKGKDLIKELSGSSFADALGEFDTRWFPVEIEVQLTPHNQWVKQYRVKDPDR